MVLVKHIWDTVEQVLSKCGWWSGIIRVGSISGLTWGLSIKICNSTRSPGALCAHVVEKHWWNCDYDNWCSVLCFAGSKNWCMVTVHYLSHVAICDCLCITTIILLLFALYRWGPPALGVQGASCWWQSRQAFRLWHVSLAQLLTCCFSPAQLFCDLLEGTQHRLLSEFRTEPSGVMVQLKSLQNLFDVT